ncbi:MAG: carbohydrate binding domain-containing protein [Bacillota bacterium]
MLYFNQEKGFTIIEVTIVVAILAIVAVAIGQLNISLSNIFSRNQKQLNLKNNINKANLYLDEDIRTAIDVEEVSDSKLKFKRPEVRTIDNNGVQENIMPDGRISLTEIEYKVELIDNKLVLKRNDKIILSHLDKDIIIGNVPQIDKVFGIDDKRVNVNLKLVDDFKNKDIDYEIKDRFYLKDRDTKGTIIYYKTSYSTTYIYYSINGGSWTDSPGIRMMDSEYSGYQKIFVELDSNSSSNTITAAFNNGNGSWDSNSNNDYSLNF